MGRFSKMVGGQNWIYQLNLRVQHYLWVGKKIRFSEHTRCLFYSLYIINNHE